MNYHLNNIEDLLNHPFTTLDSKSRFSSIKLVIPNDDAQHTCRTASLSILITNQLNDLLIDKIDIKDVVYRAVIHDFGESVSADLICTVKHGSPKIAEGMKELEAMRLTKVPCMTTDLFNDIQNSKDDESIQANILDIADKLDAFMTINREYLIQQTKEFDTLFCECFSYTSNAIKKLTDVLISKNELPAVNWLNKLLSSFEIYFRSTRLERYLGRTNLRKDFE